MRLIFSLGKRFQVEFRSGATRVLITTDVWARGLDVQQVRAEAKLGGGKGLREKRGWWKVTWTWWKGASM